MRSWTVIDGKNPVLFFRSDRGFTANAYVPSLTNKAEAYEVMERLRNVYRQLAGDSPEHAFHWIARAEEVMVVRVSLRPKPAPVQTALDFPAEPLAEAASA